MRTGDNSPRYQRDPTEPGGREWCEILWALNTAGAGPNWTRDFADEWPIHKRKAESNVVGTTMNTAMDNKKRIQGHTQRLDWMTIAPDVLKP
jgi:hypothetical protein